MRQFLVPIILGMSSVALFVMYINPTYQSAKTLQAKVQSYDDALNKSQELRRTRDEKVSAFNTFAPDNLKKLEAILPNNVDTIHLIIDINTIAGRRSLSLKNVTLGQLSDSATRRSELAVGASGSEVGSVELTFSVTASYENMLAFVQDLERSLRVMDIESITFSVDEKDRTDYTFKIRTYWLH